MIHDNSCMLSHSQLRDVWKHPGRIQMFWTLGSHIRVHGQCSTLTSLHPCVKGAELCVVKDFVCRSISFSVLFR